LGIFKGIYVCCLAWIYLFYLFFFVWVSIVLKEISISGVVDASDQVMGFAMAKVPLEREF